MGTNDSGRTKTEMGRTIWKGVLWGAIVVLLVAPTPTRSHDAVGVAVPQKDASASPPIIDGVCDWNAEYQDAWSATRLPYSTVFPGLESARVHLVSNSSNLYVCVAGMARGTGQLSSLSTRFDTQHNGGAMPIVDDVRIDIDESGLRSDFRGSVIGLWIPATAPLLAQIAVAGDDFRWNVEMSIALTELGGGFRLDEIGFHLGHTSVDAPGDLFGWPARSLPDVPNTWGDLLFVGERTDTEDVQLDAVRITQGLEMDVNAGTFYDLVAGKDTLIRAELYTFGSNTNIDVASCLVQREGEVVAQVPARGTSASLGTSPVGFTTAQAQDCWVPGTLVAEPGTYRFSVQIALEGGATQEVPLGERIFEPSCDLRLFLFATELPPAGAGPAPPRRAWDLGLLSSLPGSLAEMNRLLPLRTGVGALAENTPPQDTGLRLRVAPAVLGCLIGQDSLECDAMQRAIARRATREYNSIAQLVSFEDRIDFPLLLTAAPTLGGGQAQRGSLCTAGASYDGTSQSDFTAIHEVGHCLGQVGASSPNSNGSGHSANQRVSTFLGQPMVDLAARQNVLNGFSIMWPFVGPSSKTSAFEGFEWNDVRRRSACDGPGGSGSGTPGPGLVVDGQVDQQGQVTIYSSRRVEDLSEPYPGLPGGEWSIVFVDAAGVDLGSSPIDVTFEGAGGAPIPIAPLSVDAPLPPGAVAAEIRQGSTTLHQTVFSSSPPVIQSVTATDHGQGGIDLVWSAQDPDSSDLRYNVYFQASPTQIPVLVATGLEGSSFFFTTDFTPPASAAQLVLEVTDGYHSAVMPSNAFSVAPLEGPIVHTDLAPFNLGVEDQPITLTGAALDLATGPLPGSALGWTSNLSGFLGNGGRLTASLQTGVHVITFAAESPDGVSTLEVVVDVRPDGDRDGLADDVEAQYPCLSQTEEDAQQDADGDGASSLAEIEIGTDPCADDTDLDGFTDGDELVLGGDPLDGQSGLSATVLFLSSDEVDLGSCPSPSEEIVGVSTIPEGATFDAWPSTYDLLGGALVVSQDPTASTLGVSASCDGLSPGLHRTTLLVTAANGAARTVSITLTVPQPIIEPPLTDPSIVLAINGASSDGSVTLSWAGGSPGFRIYRSSLPHDVALLQNRIAETPQYEYTDTPPPDDIHYFRVDSAGDCFEPAADTWIWDADPDSNKSAQAALYAVDDPEDGHRESFVQFQLDAIPQGATINMATFWVRQERSRHGTYTLDLRAVDGPWSESGLTWNNAPAHGTVEDTRTYDPNPWGFRSFDVTSLVQSWFDGSRPNDGFVLLPSPGAGPTFVRLRSSRAEVEQRPLLCVDWVEP